MMLDTLAILQYKWSPDPKSKTKIHGYWPEWPEDCSEYVIEVPERLRFELVRLQNLLCDKADEIKSIKHRNNNLTEEIKKFNSFWKIDLKEGS